MSSVLILRQGLVAEDRILILRSRMRDHVAARVRADRLDRRLAAGAAPDASVQLTLRARRLLGPVVRKRMARGLRQLVQSSELPPLLAPDLMWTREQIRRAVPVLLQLAGRLDSATPLDIRGLACTHLLLTTPARPLFHRARPADRIAEAAGEALKRLTPVCAA